LARAIEQEDMKSGKQEKGERRSAIELRGQLRSQMEFGNEVMKGGFAATAAGDSGGYP